MSIQYFKDRATLNDIDYRRASPLKQRRYGSNVSNQLVVEARYLPDEPMKIEANSPEFKRRDLTDSKHAFNEPLQKDKQIVKDLDGAKFFDNDEAYLKYINTERKKLQQKPYLQVTNAPKAAPAAETLSNHGSNDNLVWPNIAEDKNKMVNWSKLPPDANNSRYFDNPDDNYY